MVFVNDLMSFYKEFDEPRDQTSLVNNYARCDGSTLEEALDKLTRDTIVDSQQILAVFKDKDAKLFETLRSFCQGYVTWHLCDPRYRLPELYESTGQTEEGAKMRAYLEAGSRVGAVDPKEWAYPSVVSLVQKDQQLQTRGEKLDVTAAPSSGIGNGILSIVAGARVVQLFKRFVGILS